MAMSIHWVWGVCWLKKTENMWFDDVFMPNFDHFVIVSIKMIISFKVVCHKLVLKGVSYPKIVKNTPILIEQGIACNVYT